MAPVPLVDRLNNPVLPKAEGFVARTFRSAFNVEGGEVTLTVADSSLSCSPSIGGRPVEAVPNAVMTRLVSGFMNNLGIRCMPGGP